MPCNHSALGENQGPPIFADRRFKTISLMNHWFSATKRITVRECATDILKISLEGEERFPRFSLPAEVTATFTIVGG